METLLPEKDMISDRNASEYGVMDEAKARIKTGGAGEGDLIEVEREGWWGQASALRNL
jgi:hypothetical protein